MHNALSLRTHAGAIVSRKGVLMAEQVSKKTKVKVGFAFIFSAILTLLGFSILVYCLILMTGGGFFDGSFAAGNIIFLTIGILLSATGLALLLRQIKKLKAQQKKLGAQGERWMSRRAKTVLIIAASACLVIGIGVTVFSTYTTQIQNQAAAVDRELGRLLGEINNGNYLEVESVAITGPVIIYIASTEYDNSPIYSLRGRSFYGISNSALTSSLEECSQIIFIYPEHTYIGDYQTTADLPSNTGAAYSTTTTIQVLDRDSKVVSYAIGIVTHDPPTTSDTKGSRYGILDPERAMEYVAKLLG